MTTTVLTVKLESLAVIDSARPLWYECPMALDPLEKEHLRRKMAERMRSILESGNSVTCVSGHYHEPPSFCELCRENHAAELLIVKNRAGKNYPVAENCLREMLRFQVAEVNDLPRWLEKIKELRAEHGRRKQQAQLEREQERQRLEKKFIVRRKDPQSAKRE